MSTIVSAFISNINSIKNINEYYKNGKLLIQSNVFKIIFVDEFMFNLIGEDYNKINTHLVKVNFSENYLNLYRNEVSNFEIVTNSPEKDTIDYIFTMCNKTEWIKQAILLNIFNTKNFIWIDFGIRYIFTCSDDEFISKINQLQDKLYTYIRIGNIWNLDAIYNIDIYKNIAWYFAGGVFGGDAKLLLNFAEKMKNKCINIISEKNSIMWETNIWYLIYLENKELFSTYECDHNNSIVDNY